MKIYFWKENPSACSHYRCDLPAVELEKLGHEVTCSQGLTFEAYEGGADIIVGQRLYEDHPTEVWHYMAEHRRSKLVLELDDDLWSLTPDNPAKHHFTDASLANLRRNIEVADLVTVTTEPLAQRIRPWNPNVAVLPNMVSRWLLDEPAPVPGDRVTIGWGGSSTHQRDFGEVAKPLRATLQKYPDEVEFHCMGQDYTERVHTLRGRTRHTGWIDGIDAVLRAVDFHVGLAPVWRSEFNASKSDLKILEYAAKGIPSVATSWDPYLAESTKHSQLLARTPREWRECIQTLAGDTALRESQGIAARNWAATRTIEDNATEWERTYTCLLT